MPTCSRCGEDNPDRGRFCLACGTPLTAGPAREVRKTVTVIFADVVGSTNLSERLDPEALRQVMTRYYDRASAVLTRHGGRVQKFIGDAVMAVFGVPAVREDDAVRAVRAAAELHAGLSELNAELERGWGVRLNLRTGVNTGEVVIGETVGGQDIALGDVVNVAARLEQVADPGEVLLGDVTYRLVRDAVTVELLPPLALKGKGLPVDAWRLLAVKPGAAGHARRLDTPLVGRGRELALLRQAFERTVAERISHLFTLLGPAGIGKSRLLHELLTRARGQATVLRGECLDYGEGITYWPLAEVVRQAAGATAADAPAEVRRKLAALLGASQPATAVVDKLTGLFGEAEPGAPIEELPEALHRLLAMLTTRRPLIVVLEDLQWAEPALLDLVEQLTDWLRDTSVLLCCLGRPELLEIRPGWGGGRVNATTILLEPLTPAECGTLLRNLLGGGEGAAATRQRLIQAAEGNPLYLEELVGMLLDDGLLAQVDDEWVTTADLSHIVVPPTIAALLAARLDGLPAGERAVLERASVVGNVFYRGVVSVLSPPEERPLVTERLLSLVRKELVRPDASTLLGESALRFRHLLIRDAAYHALSKRERADLHERCATWIEETLAERVTEVEEIVGYHLEQACRYRTGLGPVDAATQAVAERAATRLVAAGRRAFGRRDMPAAVNLLSRGVALLPHEDPTRLALLPDLAAALVEVGEFRQADFVLAEALAAADRHEDAQLRGAALRVRSVLALLMQSGDRSGERGEAGGRPAAIGTGAVGVAVGGREAAAGPGLSAGWTLLHDVGFLPSSGAAAGLGRDGAPGQATDPEAGTVDTFALSAMLGPTPVRTAIARYTADLGEPGPHSTLEVRVLAALAGLAAMEGRFDEARDKLASARAILDRLGLRVRALGLFYLAGLIELLAEEPARAEEELRRGRADCERIGEKYVLANLLALLAQATYAQGRYDEALRHAEAAQEVAPGDELIASATARGAEAKALARLGRPEPAERLARAAAAAVAGSDLLTVRADALLDLAEVLELVGAPAAAAEQAAQARDLYQRKGNLVSARRATSALGRLRGPD